MRPLEPALQPNERPPRLNGRYVVTRLLGRGAQARVYLAYDARLKQWRALKVLAAQFIDDEPIRNRFDQEAQAMARLSHPNLLRVVDIDHDGRTPFMVMELARGGSITEWMRRNGPFPPRLACKVVVQCCDGLAHAHSQGVIHRDVKPHNLLIKDDGTVVLTDFGIAHVDDGDLTQTGHVMGTFAFMAPEQRTDAKGVDPRADVYALGASFYTMLTAKTSAELFFAESRDSILDGIPEAVQSLILGACKYDREARYASAMDFKLAVERKLPRLPLDPDGTSLLDGLLSLPDGPPDLLPHDAQVDDLRKTIALGSGEVPTFLPTKQALDALLEEHPTTLYSDTGSDEMATVLPYQMPSVDKTPRRARASITELSEEDVPDYIDQTTLDSSRNRGRVEITSEGPVFVASPKVPVSVSVDSAPTASRSTWMAAGGVVAAAIALVLLVLVWGVAQKSIAAGRQAKEGEALITMVASQATWVRDLQDAGARADIRSLWFTFEDAPPGNTKAAAAAAFGRVAIEEAERLARPELQRVPKAQLERQIRAWEAAGRQLEATRSSRLGQITGG